ncbi:hypothetical protein OQZ55_00260 [Bacillus subtilis]|uniref:hypothetical protein n=1 Tax=Bacillus subtilis TaxID=1423 RepID=UPI0022590BFD|nr:hypothetical protein [Bacillus subtilis]MCX4074748.1 hypothetical protein [Bacillus subtilis]
MRLPAFDVAAEINAPAAEAQGALFVPREIQDRRSRPRGSMANAMRLPAFDVAAEINAPAAEAQGALFVPRRSRTVGAACGLQEIRHASAGF